jgi:hypothetical protein
MSLCSSDSVVPDYWLGGRSSIPGKGQGFSFGLYVLSIYGDHPASYPMGTGGPLPGGKVRPGREADHSLSPSRVAERL